MEEELDRGRRISRRRMGRIAFLLLMAEAVALMCGVFVGGPLFATNIKAASTVLIGLFWAQAALVGAYLGVSLTEAMNKK